MKIISIFFIYSYFICQILTITNSFGMKLKDLLQFKRWFEFSNDVELTISNISIISVATADSMIIKFYEVELERYTEKKKAETDRLDNPEEEIEDDDHGGVKGNLSLDFNFQDQDQLQMFMENIQMGIEGLLDEMHDDGIEEEDQENNNLNFEDGEFELNDNFEISEKGLTFLFNQYEIGPYAIGMPEIFIPYSKMKGLIKEDGVLKQFFK